MPKPEGKKKKYSFTKLTSMELNTLNARNQLITELIGEVR
jgi:hypothetical protein